MNTYQTSLLSKLLYHLKKYLSVIGVCALAFFIFSCNGNDSDSDEFTVQTTSTQDHGEVMTDGEGNVLYYFTPDVEGNSACEGNCINAWPIFNADEFRTGDGLEPANFGTITRADGSSQTTYFGWPLYYFSGDNQPGDTNGDAIESFGGIWYVAKPDYSIVNATQQLIGHDGNSYTDDYTVGEALTTHLTDVNGRTLYIFSFDSANTNKFTAEDFSNNSVWPIFEEDLNAVPSALDKSLFGSIDVFGRTQLTYKGWPLYQFGQDTERGQTKGVSFPQPGIWPVAQVEIVDAPGF